jgi:hypothetical protein
MATTSDKQELSELTSLKDNLKRIGNEIAWRGLRED